MTQSHVPVARVLTNTLWNLFGYGVLFLVQLLTLPWIVHGVGEHAFGLWALAGIVPTYLTFMELGLRRAVVRSVSVYRARKQIERLPAIVWTAVGMLVGLASVVILAVGACSPLILDRGLHVSPAWISLAAHVLILRTFTMVADWLAGLFRAVPAGYQDMGVLNRWQMLLYVALFSGYVLIAWKTASILGMALWAAILHGIAIGVFYHVARRRIPNFRWTGVHRSEAKELLRFGGWLTVSHMVEPVLLHTEKLLIARWLGATVLTFYIVPYQLITRVWHVMTGFSNALFPAISDHVARADTAGYRRLTLLATRWVSGALIWPLMLLAVFADSFMNRWMGAAYGERSGPVLAILCMGVWINVLSWPVFALYQAQNRTKIPAMYHLLETVIHIPVCILTIVVWGLPGAAVAWAIRMVLDTGILLGDSVRRGMLPWRGVWRAVVNPSTCGAFCAGWVLLGIRLFSGDRLAFIAAVPAALLGTFLVWHTVLGSEARTWIRRILRLYRIQP